jgi:hypothetical protein
MSGLFSNTSPQWLLEKLRSDFENLASQPTNAAMAFNFFVTAESLLDWCAPGYKNKSLRKNLRDDDVLLQIASHIASNAKHYQSEANHHNSVTSTSYGRRSGLKGGRLFSGTLNQGNLLSGGGNLTIQLTGPALTKFGNSITALELARITLKRWDEPISKFDRIE